MRRCDHGLREAGYGYWGFSPPTTRRRLPRVRRRRDRHERRRLRVRPGAHVRRRRLRRLPRGAARADEVRPRRGDPARVVPGAGLRAARGARQPLEAAADLRRLRARRVLRRGRRRDRQGVQALPRARPGHGHGRARQCARPRPPAGLLRARPERQGAAAAGQGAVHGGVEPVSARADWEARSGAAATAGRRAGAAAARRRAARGGGRGPGDAHLGAGRGRGRLPAAPRVVTRRPVGARRPRRRRRAAAPRPRLRRHHRRAGRGVLVRDRGRGVRGRGAGALSAPVAARAGRLGRPRR